MIRSIKALDNNPLKKNFMHHIYPYIQDNADIHFMIEEEQSSKDNELYTMIRTCNLLSE